MRTFGTLIDAQEYTGNQAVAIAEIMHADHGRCFIRVAAPINVLRQALAAKPMPEIKSIIAEHPIMTPAQASAEQERINAEIVESLRTKTKCERCAAHIDGNTAKKTAGVDTV